MRKQAAAAVLAAGLVAGGGAALAIPSAYADGTAAGGGLAGRISSIEGALKGLVSGGTITQAQADAVAQHLAQARPGIGGHGRRRAPLGLSPTAVAAALGVTPAQLRADREAGRTLTQVAAAHAMGRADLVAKLTSAARAALAADLKAGRISQRRYDRATATLTTRIGRLVDAPPRHRSWAGDHEGNGPDTSPAPSPTATS